jgi:hypothetical protein
VWIEKMRRNIDRVGVRIQRRGRYKSEMEEGKKVKYEV